MCGVPVSQAETYLERLSGKDRHELKRKIRKLERELDVLQRQLAVGEVVFR